MDIICLTVDRQVSKLQVCTLFLLLTHRNTFSVMAAIPVVNYFGVKSRVSMFVCVYICEQADYPSFHLSHRLALFKHVTTIALSELKRLQRAKGE